MPVHTSHPLNRNILNTWRRLVVTWIRLPVLVSRRFTPTARDAVTSAILFASISLQNLHELSTDLIIRVSLYRCIYMRYSIVKCDFVVVPCIVCVS